MSDTIIINPSIENDTIIINPSNDCDSIIINPIVENDNIIINDSNNAVLSVNGRIGNVVLNSSDVGLTIVNTNSANWNSSYSSVYANSALWTQGGNSVALQSLSSNWNSNYITTNSLSANWNSVYSTVQSNSATNWNYQGTDLKTLSSTWVGGNTAYTNLISNSAAYLSAVDLSLIQSTSANWNSVYSNVNSNSSTYATYNYINNGFLPLSGGIISGATRINNNLTVFGNLTASGTTTFANTIFSVTSSLSVVHIGSGPALWVGNNGDGDIASFYDIDQNIEILHIGGINSSFPNVGIKTSSPNVDFTVNGQISSNNTIWDANGNSNNWNDVYSTVQSNSATNWNYQGTDLKDLSGNWQSSFETVNTLSGNWNSVYSSWNSASATSVVEFNDTRFAKLSSQAYTLVDATSSIQPTRGGNVASGKYSVVAGGGSKVVISGGGGGGGTLANNILAYYKLDDDGSGGVSLVDSTGNGNTLTNNNGAILGTGKINGSVILDSGASQTLTTSTPFTPTGNSSFSFSTWIKLSEEFIFMVFSYGAGYTNGAVGLYVPTPLRLNLQFWNNGVGDIPVTANEWHHVVGTYDGTTAKIYVNGALMDSLEVTLNVGSDNFAFNRWVNGSMGSGVCSVDEFGFWSRALSQVEVNELYNSGSGVSYPFTQLTNNILAYYKLDNDGSGGVSLVDSTGNGYTLTNNGNVVLGDGKIDNGGQWPTPFNSGLSPWIQNDSIAISGDFSFSCWVYPSAFSDQTFVVPFCIGDWDPNRVLLLIFPNGDTYALFNGNSYILDASINFSSWNHVAVVGNSSSGILTYYINGIATSPVNVGTFSGLNKIFLGCANDQASSQGSFILEGNLDEVGIWNRALTQTEVNELYNSNAGLSYPFGGGGSVTTLVPANTASGDYSFIAGGSNNNTNNQENTFILGSNITAVSANYTYVNNLSSQGLIAANGGNSNQWNNAYSNSTIYSNNSASYATIGFTDSKYLPISGGEITQDLYIDGSVGIGTTTPITKLDVKGDGSIGVIRVSTGDSTGDAFEAYSIPSYAGFQAYNRNALTTVDMRMVAKDYLFLAGTNTDNLVEAVRVKSDGNVGIGTTTPATKLHVVKESNSVNDPVAVIESTGGQVPFTVRAGGIDQGYVKGDTEGFLAFGAQADVVFEAGGFGETHEVARFTAGGNVGIGTTTPLYKLDVIGSTHINNGLVVGDGATFSLGSGYGMFTSTAGENAGFTINRGNNGSYASLDFVKEGNPDTGWSIQSQPSSDDLTLFDRVNNTNNVTFQAGGNVGIGTTNPISKLQIEGATTGYGTNDGNARFLMNVDTNNNPSIELHTGKTGFNKGFAAYIDFVTTDDADYDVRLIAGDGSSVANIFQIDSNKDVAFTGAINVGIGTTTPTTKLDVNGTITATGGNSDQWNEAYNNSTVYAVNSAFYATNTDLNAASSVLLPTSIYQDASGNWQSTFGTVNFLSGNWNSGFNTGTVYSQNSASYATNDFVNSNFLTLSGGTISGATRINNNLTVFGNLTATGTTTFANTIFSVTSSLSVVHVGSGPALWVGNNGDGDIASFYDIDQNIEILHVGGNNGAFPNVGVKTSSPNVDFTVNGQISANNIIWSANGNSNNWNSVYSNVNSQSANNVSVYNNVNSLSANWNSVYSSWNSTSATLATNTALNAASSVLLPTSIYQNTSGSFATNTLLQSTSAFLTPLTLTNNLTSQLVLNTTFNNYQTNVATSTATLLPTTIYQNASGNWNSVYSSWNSASATSVVGFNDTRFSKLSSQAYILNGNAIQPVLGNNTITSTFKYSVINGGCNNTICGPSFYSDSSIGGGTNNTIISNYGASTIGGGDYNTITINGSNGTIAGGFCNTASGANGTIAGGTLNTASGSISNVAGGRCNTASGCYSNVVGGLLNTAIGSHSNVAGGRCNTASGAYSTILGGRNSIASSYGEIAHSASSFNSISGSFQHSIFTLSTITSSSVPKNLALDGNVLYLTLSGNIVYHFNTNILAVNTTNGLSNFYTIKGIVKNINNNISLSPTTIKEELEEDTNMDVDVYIDTINKYMTLQVIGASAQNIRWGAVLDTVRITY